MNRVVNTVGSDNDHHDRSSNVSNFSENSRLGGATTRRSFSEIRQKYCQMKQQEKNLNIVEEWKL